MRREYNNVRELQQAQGSHDFGEAWTAQYDPAGDQAVSFTGVGVASMALGLPTYLSNQYNRGYFYFQQTEAGLVLPRQLESHSPADAGTRGCAGRSGRSTRKSTTAWSTWTSAISRTRFQVVTPGNTTMESMPGIPPRVLDVLGGARADLEDGRQGRPADRLIPADNNDFGPRLGAAYRLTNKTVLRAGYGEYFWTMPLSQILQTSRTNPPLNLRYTNPLGTLDGTSSFAIRTAPQPEYYVGKAQVDINGNIVISPTNAQSAIPYDSELERQQRAGMAFHHRAGGDAATRLCG